MPAYRAALEVHPYGAGEELELWIDPKLHSRRLLWSFPAGNELRVGVARSGPPSRQGADCALAGDLSLPADGYQGNWIPTSCDPRSRDSVFFVGDSAGTACHWTAEGIRNRPLLRACVRP